MFVWEENFNYPDGALLGLGGWDTIPGYSTIHIVSTLCDESTSGDDADGSVGNLQITALADLDWTKPIRVTQLVGFNSITDQGIHSEFSLGKEEEAFHSCGSLLFFNAGGLASHTAQCRLFVPITGGANSAPFAVDPTGPIKVVCEIIAGIAYVYINDILRISRTCNVSQISTKCLQLYLDARIGQQDRRWCSQIKVENFTLTGQCALSWTALGVDGTPKSEVDYYLQVINAPSGDSVDATPQTIISSVGTSSPNTSITVLQGCTCRIRRGVTGTDRVILIPNTSTADLYDLLAAKSQDLIGVD